MTRYAIFVHDPEGDSGYGVIVGPFRGLVNTEVKVDAIYRAAKRTHPDRDIECIVLPVRSGASSAAAIVAEVLET